MDAKRITDKGDVVTVNAARVSMNKRHLEFNPAEDCKLLAYLSSHAHWTPFSHIRHTFRGIDLELDELTPELMTGMVWASDYFGDFTVRHSIYGWYQLCVSGVLCQWDRKVVQATIAHHYPECYKSLFGDVKAFKTYAIKKLVPPPNDYFIDYTLLEEVPIYVARQRFKHMVGFTYNEISRRYVSDDIKFHNPESYRSRPPKSIKQGSGDGFVESIEFPVAGGLRSIEHCVGSSDSQSLDLYEAMINGGVAPELARGELPQKTYTQYYVTGNLVAWKRAYSQRIDSHAQKEIRDLADIWAKEIPELTEDKS